MPERSQNILNVPPTEDQGSESKAGFDYQDHCAARLCLLMITSNLVSATVCEYHEDVVQLMVNGPPCFYSIKKRESVSNWTVGMLKDPISKLFDKLQYKNVGSLSVIGHGRTKKGNFSLRELIALLDCPNAAKDKEWECEIDKFASHLQKKWGSKIDLQNIRDGLRRLSIKLDWPHPDAIALENINLAFEIILKVWGVTTTPAVAKRAYRALFERVQAASIKPQLPLSVKSINRDEALSIVRGILASEKLIAESSQMVIDTHTKLANAKLQKHLQYALEQRMRARELKFSLDLSSVEWKTMKDDIAIRWERKRQRLKGVTALKKLRELFRAVGQEWQAERRNGQLNQEFAEGLFFEMLAVCEADFETAK